MPDLHTVNTDPILSCDREPIHVISGIQDRGFLLGLDPQDLTVRMISENTAKILHKEVAAIITSPLSSIFDHTLAKRVSLTIQSPWWKSGSKSHFTLTNFMAFREVDVYLYESQGLILMEIEFGAREDESPDAREDETETLNRAIEEIKNAEDSAVAGLSLCAAIRHLTGMDRVMVYRFLAPEMHGVVIAESKSAEAHSFNHHRFPATDIPKPARDLYLRNRVRFIHDSASQPSPLIPALNPVTKKPLDMSDSRLRAVSPIHLEYLRNMKVVASFSTAIIVNDHLWGLVACHHSETLRISHRTRTSCELLSNVYAVRVKLEASVLMEKQRANLEDRLTPLLSHLSSSVHPLMDFFKNHRAVEEAFRASGIALIEGDDIETSGLTPPKSVISDIKSAVLSDLKGKNKTVLKVESLSEWHNFKSTPEVSGLFAQLIPGEIDTLIIIFRPEVIQNVRWGGDPNKSLQKRDYQGRINPRVSFASYEETIRDRCEPWSQAEVDFGISFFQIMFNGIIKKDRLVQELSMRMGKR